MAYARWRRVLLALAVLATSLPSLTLTSAHAPSKTPRPVQSPLPLYEANGVFGANPEAIAAGRAHLYVAIGSRVAVLDLGTPDGLPRLTAMSPPLREMIIDLAPVTEGVVVASSSTTVYFIDVSTPQTPVALSEFPAPESAISVSCSQGFCFVVGEQHLHCIDARDPARPVPAAAFDLAGRASINARVIADGDLLFVGPLSIGGGIFSVLVLDVSDPARPVVLGGIEEEIRFRGMAAADGFLYVLHDPSTRDASGNRRFGVDLLVLQVTPRKEIVKHGRVALVPLRPSPDYQPAGIVAEGSCVCLTGADMSSDEWSPTNQMRCWDMSAPASPRELARLDSPRIGGAVDVVAANGRIYLLAEDARLKPGGFESPVVGVADVRDAQHPQWLGDWQLDDVGKVGLIATWRDTLIVAESYGYWHLYDVSTPGHIGWKDYVVDSMNLHVYFTVTHGDRLFAIDTVRDNTGSPRASVSAFDLTRAENLPRLDHVAIRGALPTMAVDGSLVFVAEGRKYAPPTEESGYALVVLRFGMAQDGSPARFERLGEVPAAAYLRSIAVCDGFVYVVLRDNQRDPEYIGVVDVADPTLPLMVSRLQSAPGVRPRGITVGAGYAYVVVGADPPESAGGPGVGLDIMDVSQPGRPQVVGSVRSPSAEVELADDGVQDYRVATIGDYAFYSGNEPILHVVDVRDPRAPLEIQRIVLPDVISQIVPVNSDIFVRTRRGEVWSFGVAEERSVHPLARTAFLPLAVQQ